MYFYYFDIYGGNGELGATSAIKKLEVNMLMIQQEIFLDLAWQHEAYIGDGTVGGITEITRLNGIVLASFDKELTDDAMHAWAAINVGGSNGNSCWQGNVELLRREQAVVVGRGYSEFRKVTAAPELMSALVENPFRIVGGHTFPLFSINVGAWSTEFRLHKLTNFEDRWNWMQDEMVAPWRNATQSQRDTYVGASFNFMVEDFPGW
jgi:hypothetical protein